MTDSQTSPTREEVEQQQGSARAAFIEQCKRALHVFKTDDYRVTVRGAVNFEARIRATEKPRPEVICLCRSSRFIEHLAIFGWELEKGGAIVLSLHYLPPSYPGVASSHQAEAEGIAAAMDELHLRKIDMSDRVIVMNVGGYYGDSTRREIAYAESIGRPVSFLEDRADD